MKRTRARAAIYVMAAVYLFYLSFQMFRDRGASTGSEFTLLMIFAGAFVLIGIGLIVFSIRIVRNEEKAKEQPEIEKTEEKTEETEESDIKK